MFSPQFRHVFIEPFQVGETAAEDDDMGIEDVDDTGQGAGQAGFVTAQGGFGSRVLSGGAVVDLTGGQGFAGVLMMVAAQTGAGEEGFDATVLTAITGRSRPFIGAGPGEGVVTPFAGDGVGAGQQSTIDGDAAADTGAEDHPENHLRPRGGAIDRFRQGETVGVVGQSHRSFQDGFQVPLQVLADQTGGVGIFDAPGGRRQSAGNTDANGATATAMTAELAHQLADGRHCGAIIPLGSGQTAAVEDGTIISQDRPFNFGSTQIDADAHAVFSRFSRSNRWTDRRNNAILSGLMRERKPRKEWRRREGPKKRAARLARQRSLEREAAEATRIREFHGLFPAREGGPRQFTLYLGPTNSGKTHQALKRLATAESGTYLAPLRLLALEVSETLNEWGVPCNMVTGEERIPVEGARHTASTIEMLSTGNRHALCVIDEAQMLGDPDRGWAWTQAILGAWADEVCVVGSPECRPVVEKLLHLTGDPCEIIELERLTPLQMVKKAKKNFHELEPGSAIITFSRAGVLGLKGELERQTGKRAAVLYGALPPEVRRNQARLFATGEMPYLVATDAIGMGLNLPIRTLLFAQDSKFIDRREYPLTPLEVRQIAGRAGRYGHNERGFVGTFRIPTSHIAAALEMEPEPVSHAPLAPNLDHLLAMSVLDENRRRPSLARLMTLFVRSVKPDPRVYRLSDLEDQIALARITDRFETLDLPTRFALSAAPVNLNATDMLVAFDRMVAAVAFDRPLSMEAVWPQGLEGGRHTVPDRGLGTLETAMRVVNLYCWLHYRFPDHLPDLEMAENRRKEINKKINRMLRKKGQVGKRATDDRRPMSSFMSSRRMRRRHKI